MHMTYGPSHVFSMFFMYLCGETCAYGEYVQLGCWGVHSMRRWENNMCTLQAKYYNNKNVLQVFLCKTKGHCIISPSSHSNFGISMQNSENEWLCTNDNNDARGNQNNINKTSVILSVLHSSRSSAGEHILTFITKFVLQYIKKKKTHYDNLSRSHSSEE